MADRSGSGDIERSLQLLWDVDPGPKPGPRRSLDVATIVDAAIAIADAEGLDAVSIRSVARALGVGPMSLYRYIPSKAELLDLMLDRVNQPIEDELPDGWRPAMEAIGRALWRMYTVTHPWLPFVDQTRPVLGPNSVRALEVVIGALRNTGLTDQEKVSLMVVVDAFTSSLARTATSMAAAEARTKASHDEFWSSQEAYLVRAMESGEYPHMAELGDDAFGASNDGTFEFGLARILDGTQALLDARRRQLRGRSRHG